MAMQRLLEYLDENQVKYVIIKHSPAYTAQEIAASAHIPGKELAKTVMIKLDGDLCMAVLPASFRVDFDHLKEATGASHVELATEDEFKRLFPNCEVGAMPPFGNLFDLPVLVADSLKEDEEITFNAGTHMELLKMTYSDFKKLVQPKVMDFSVKSA